MKIILLIALMWLILPSHAQDVNYYSPLHNAREVVLAVYKKAGVKPSEVKVVVFEYNYLKGEWHIELAPSNTPCIDCYPAYYIKNDGNLTVIELMHG